MVNNQFLSLRNRLHEDSFRFDMPASLWKRHYLKDEKAKAANLLRILQNGALRGYAIYSKQFFNEEIKAYKILEICAENRDVFTHLVDQITERAFKEDFDFIYFTKGSTEFSEVLSGKSFFSFSRNAIMITLLNPQALFSSLSEEVTHGRALRLIIEGFDPVFLKIGEKGVMIIPESKPALTVTTDSRTFVNLFFGKSSFLKQYFHGRVSVSSLFDLPTAVRFFRVIRQKRWYIPPGDWL